MTMARTTVPGGVLAQTLASSRRVARRVSAIAHIPAPAKTAPRARSFGPRPVAFLRAPAFVRGGSASGAGRARVLARAATEEDLEKTLGSFDETPGDETIGGTTSGDGALVVDWKAIGTYFAATATQIGVMMYLTNWFSAGVTQSGLAVKYQNAIVGAWFLFNALRSRTFSPLEASRPKLAEENKAVAERKRPRWMPPPLAFPIIWTAIAALRAASSAAVFAATGTLNHPAIFAMCAHLAVGDTWNYINNVEKRLGTASVGVGFVALSAYTLVFQYFRVDRTAGLLIAPSAAWITVAAGLVWTIWNINPGKDGEREPLAPMTAKKNVSVA
jgi:tryptophan-rich sensory protein